MKYVSMDLETTGVMVRDHSRILMISMVVEDTKQHNVPVEDLPHFTAIVQNEAFQGEATALVMNAWILVAIEFHKSKMTAEKFFIRQSELGIPQDTIAKGVAAQQKYAIAPMDKIVPSANLFLSEHFGTKDKITVAGKNAAGFDMTFLPMELKDRFRHSVIDPGSIFWNPDTDRMLPHSSEVMKRAGLPYVDAHDALGDARMMINALRRSPFYYLVSAIDLLKSASKYVEQDSLSELHIREFFENLPSYLTKDQK